MEAPASAANLMNATMNLLEDSRIHVGPWIEAHVEGSLDESTAKLLEAHLVTCDCCFAAWLSVLLRPAAA
jgi:hypothetical protein